MTQAKQDSRCSGLTKKGKPCRAAATEGGLCFFYANPEKAAELGRIGGRRNSRVIGVLDPLLDLDSVTAVRDAVKTNDHGSLCRQAPPSDRRRPGLSGEPAATRHREGRS
jgi:hypothetical protein